MGDRSKANLPLEGIGRHELDAKYFNTGAEHLRSLDDVREGDKIAGTA